MAFLLAVGISVYIYYLMFYGSRALFTTRDENSVSIFVSLVLFPIIFGLSFWKLPTIYEATLEFHRLKEEEFRETNREAGDRLSATMASMPAELIEILRSGRDEE